MNNQEMALYCKLSTVGLHSLSKDIIPTGSASGCIIRYENKRLILTVEHAVGNGEKWAIKCEITDDFKQKYYFPRFTHLVKGAVNTNIINSSNINPATLFIDPKSVDYSIDLLPEEHMIVEYFLSPDGRTLNGYLKNEIITNLEDTPNTDDSYYFYGETKTKLDQVNKRIITTEKYIAGMKYLKEFGDFYIFELPEIIKDKSDFQGCSGAPILNQNGKLISLVTSGCTGTNRLLGINLKRYKVVVDLEIGKYK